MNRELTASDILNMVESGTDEMIRKANAGRQLTKAQYADAYLRTFPLFLDSFLNRITAQFGTERGNQVRNTVTAFLESEFAGK